MDYENIISGIILTLGVFIVFIAIISLTLLIIYLIGRYHLFKKAGKNGWEALIPFYNNWIYVEIADLNKWWFILIIAPSICSILSLGLLSPLAFLISQFGLFVCNYNISKKMNQNIAITILMTLFPIIVIPILGISKKYTFNPNIKVSKNGPFETNNKDNTNYKYCSNCGNKIQENVSYCPNCGKEAHK